MNESVQAALADVARMMARYGSAQDIYEFPTRELAKEFSTALMQRYPFTGYGTCYSSSDPASNKHYIEWFVGPAD